ncbi:MAG: hypothetical protein AAFY88_30885, partial [Acidobacteriota bacterium]
SVVAGDRRAIEATEALLCERGVATRRLATSHAFHSPLVAGAAEPFRRYLESVELRPPEIPFLSNVTGRWITEEQATRPDYWAEHLLRPVRFADGLAELTRTSEPALLEVGPGRTLSRLAARLQRAQGPLRAFASLDGDDGQGPDDERRSLLAAVGHLACDGVDLEWTALHGDGRRRIPLPTYPFERQHFPAATGSAASGDFDALAPIGKIPDPRQWLYRPGWRRLETGAEATSAVDVRLVFRYSAEQTEALVDAFEDGATTIYVEPGESFERFPDGRFTVAPTAPDDYRQLLEEVAALGPAAPHIIHLWQLGEGSGSRGAAGFEGLQGRGFYSLLPLLKSLGGLDAPEGSRVDIVSQGV